MSARGFKPIFMAAGVAGAALGCYLVSLKVAAERAALDKVETQIVLAQRDIRLLNTEIGTRGRLAQLERWNARVIRLSAPDEDQFVESGFQLAALVVPERVSPVEAPVVLASAPAPVREAPAVSDERASAPVSDLMHTASYTLPQPAARNAGSGTAPVLGDESKTAKAPGAIAPAGQGARAAAQGAVKPAVKGAVKPAAKPAKTAMADPLAPLPGAGASAKAGGGGKAPKSRPSKEPGSSR